MGMPTNLQRIKISSELELKTWFAKNPNQTENVMLITYVRITHKNHVSSRQVQEVLEEYGWRFGFKYTLNNALLAHVIMPPVKTSGIV